MARSIQMREVILYRSEGWGGDITKLVPDGGTTI
jgi:hypothetical protein